MVAFGAARSSPDATDAAPHATPLVLDADDVDDEDPQGEVWAPPVDSRPTPIVEAVGAPRLRAVALGPTTRHAARAPPRR